MRKRRQFLRLVTVIILAGVVACRSKELERFDETELPFETIERRPYGSTGKLWRSAEPGLRIIAAPGDLVQSEDFFTHDARAQLRSLDFERYFVITAFQGFQGNLPPDPFGIEIQRIIKEGDAIKSYAHIYKHVGEVVRRPVNNSPYHLVKVPRENEIQGEIEFILIVDGTVVSRQTHRLP